MGVIPESSRAYCAACDKAVWKSRTSAPVQYCLDCKRAGRAELSHGASGYGRGCRCDDCRAGHAGRIRAYYRKRAAKGETIPRSLRSAVCESCGISFMARADVSGRFCSMACAGNEHGRTDWSNGDRQKISKLVRDELFRAANGICQLCFAPTRPEVDPNHPRYPNVDHIVPWSRGGTNDYENLRLACRQCNVRRGANEAWVPEMAEAG